MPRRWWRRCARAGLRAEADLRNEKINYKVREHSLAKVPVILAVGQREVEDRTVSLRRLGEKESRVARARRRGRRAGAARRRRPTCAEVMAGLRAGAGWPRAQARCMPLNIADSKRYASVNRTATSLIRRRRAHRHAPAPAAWRSLRRDRRYGAERSGRLDQRDRYGATRPMTVTGREGSCLSSIPTKHPRPHRARLGSADAVASAARAGGSPASPSDLRRLGIERDGLRGDQPGLTSRRQSSSEQSCCSTSPLPRRRRISGRSSAMAAIA